ncbi:MAG: AI-2E family transporter [Bacteroidota bacterium]
MTSFPELAVTPPEEDLKSAPAAYLRQPDRHEPRSMADRGLRWALSLGVISVTLLAVWYFASLVVYLGIGVLLAYLLKPLVNRLQGIGIPRIPAIVIAAVAVVGFLITLGTYLAPPVIRQLSDLSQQLTIDTITQVSRSVEVWLDRFLPIPEGTIMESMQRAGDTLMQEDRLTAAFSSLVTLFTDLFYAVLVIPFVTFFFLKDGTKIRHALFRLVPNRHFEITLSIVDKVETILGRYFRGLVVQCASIALVASLLLHIVGLRYAVPVGLFTGLANTIPYFGPFIGFLAGGVVAISQTGNFSLVPGVLVAMVLTQIADNAFFQPLIFARVARTHPLIILFVVLIGAHLAGIIGMLIAIPLATVIRVAIEQVVWSFRNYRILQSE